MKLFVHLAVECSLAFVYFNIVEWFSLLLDLELVLIDQKKKDLEFVLTFDI